MKNIETILVILVVIFVFESLGCSKRDFKDLPRWTDNNPKGWYKFLEPITHRCSDRYSDVKFQNKLVLMESLRCSNLPMGMDAMRNGYNYLPLNLFMKDVVFPLICSDKLINFGGKNYTLPENLLVQTVDEVEYAVSNHTKGTISNHLLKSFGNKIDENLIQRSEVYSEILQKTHTDFIQGIQVKYIKFMAEIQNIEPSRALLFRYRSLDNDLFGDIASYLEFVARYGSFIRTKSIFGGFIEFLTHTIINADATQENLNDFIYTQTNESKIIFRSGGHFLNNIIQWKQSLTDNSVHLNSEIIPIYDFISPTLQTQKKESLKQMVDYTVSNAKLRYTLKSLQSLDLDLSLADFLINAMSANVDYVCTSSMLDHIIDNWIIKTDNMKLDRYTVECTNDRYFWPEMNEEYVTTRVWKLLPGICLTNKQQFSTCVHVHLTLPVGIDCINFFTEEGCTGERYATLNSEIGLADAILNSKSFAYC